MKAKTVVVVGGGWAGCAAAVSAQRALGERGRVVVLERTDMLLGLGLCGGIFRNNGRFVAAEECLALGGGGDLIRVMDETARHQDIEFPGHRHASLYDVDRIEAAVGAALAASGVAVRASFRVAELERCRREVRAVVSDQDERLAGDAFVDATGTAGPPGNCILYGRGCAMCIVRCPSFGPRRGLAELAGVAELTGRRPDGRPGSFSGSCDLRPESLGAQLRGRLTAAGVAVIDLPPDLQDPAKLAEKACQQYNLPEFGSSLVLLDTGPAKMMSPYLPLDVLRRLPGLERARYAEPLAGGRGNAVRFVGMARCGPDLRVKGLANVFAAGEKAGPAVGHTEAVVSGMLAGHNAARSALGLEPLTLPGATAAGDFLASLARVMRREALDLRLTFAGAWFFARMRAQGVYTQDVAQIRERVRALGLDAALNQPLR